MKFKTYRLNKNMIFEKEGFSLEMSARTACLFGYPFIKHGEDYYEVILKKYKNKPEMIETTMIQVELVSHKLVKNN